MYMCTFKFFHLLCFLLQLWEADSLKLLGVFRGHRRGIWCVQFSPVDQVGVEFVFLTCGETMEGGLITLKGASCWKFLEI